MQLSKFLDKARIQAEEVDFTMQTTQRSSSVSQIFSRYLLCLKVRENGALFIWLGTGLLRHLVLCTITFFSKPILIIRSQYQVASTAVASGLSPGSTIGAVFLGHVLVSIACACNGWVGATYGINFPTFSRASFGIRGTAVAVICRAVAAIVWFGTQTYQGGQCVEVMLRAIWPSFKTFPNHLPASAHVTSSQMLCFFIFYIIQLPLLWIHISKLRYLFMVKVVIMPIFGFTLFGWAVGRAHGFGPVFSQGTNTTTTPAAVLFFSAMTSAIAPKATLALNICDFTRYAKSRRTVVWTNIFSLSIPVTLCAILGVVVTSAVKVIYGVTTWNPLQVCELWSSRAAQFFAAFCWALAVIATNISANSTAVGNDLMILFPEYINIRRGQYICAILGVAACPWIVQNSAKSFTSFLGGYSIFLGPVAGILLSDYFILRHRNLEIPALYRHGRGQYWYTSGFNWRAILAFTLALIPNLPGFAGKVNSHLHVPVGATYLFSVVWPVGVVVASVLYLTFSFFFPPLIERKEVQTTFTSHDDNFADEKDEKDTSAIVHIQGV
ncbi:NCS1 nucleoside transporter family [Desarmillaria tabescens]|uniref:NCS1 nucleoside transporter family n=1 Tax=Armillaria tabescens TaxID=1929756 RepID=A0AA39KFN7_ARMTA|nr:NCS1 nucleoside transporter family [Desarmillaria tabescens]KAK0459011.1 NCS1 nucleoside transporter family [Desarmillaria tabescens]